MISNIKNDFVRTESQKQEMELNQWIWDSHFWEEIPDGYFTCKWCKGMWTSTTPLDKNVRLCIKNPAILRLNLVDNG